MEEHQEDDLQAVLRITGHYISIISTWEHTTDVGQLGHCPLGDGALLVLFAEPGHLGWFVLRGELEPEDSGLPGLSSLLLSEDGEAPSVNNLHYINHCPLLTFLSEGHMESSFLSYLSEYLPSFQISLC